MEEKSQTGGSEWLDGRHSEKFDFKATEKLFYQAELFLRAHYEDNPLNQIGRDQPKLLGVKEP